MNDTHREILIPGQNIRQILLKDHLDFNLQLGSTISGSSVRTLMNIGRLMVYTLFLTKP